MKKLVTTLLAVAIAAGVPGLNAQIRIPQEGQNPPYTLTVNVVERTATAINYRHRSGSTTIDFRGTSLMPKANGEAKVESKQGYIEVEVEFDELEPPSKFGPEYLTYVMWAITPEGRATNMGEVILNGNRSKLNVTTELQAFGLVVTAEPYFAVSQPSDVVVMENRIRRSTEGNIEQVDAKYELLERGLYTVKVPPTEVNPLKPDRDTPLDLYEARNAVRIAQWAGAGKDATDTFNKAQALLQQAESLEKKRSNFRTISMLAREAVQTAEDSRLIALRAQEDQRQEAERQAAADREAQAQAQADLAARQRQEAEQQQRLETERRARAEAEAEIARRDAEIAAQRAQLESERARQTVEQAEREKQELRGQLAQQLNLILETRESARGLIVNLSDVLFDTGKYSLKPGAREKLAKVAGIVLSHPGLTLEVEGHTDGVGTDEFNMELSRKRADSVRTFLVEQGIPDASITSRGFGESQPVVTNDTAAGRQQNRRVEMIVSGDIIGTTTSTSQLQPR
jgi:outer membrane protein OmpA-like peptidoglycan-associated protein